MPISEAYHIDRMEGLAQFPNNYFDWAIDDPPYGGRMAIHMRTGEGAHVAARKEYNEFLNVAPPPEYFVELKRKTQNQIIWGANFFGLKGGYLCWNKNGTAFGEAELAYISTSKAVHLIEYTWNGMIQANMKNKEDRIHSCQKPLDLYMYLLREIVIPKYKGAGRPKVLDCHMGSQNLRIACWLLDVDFVGFEIDKQIYDDGCAYYEENKIKKLLF